MLITIEILTSLMLTHDMMSATVERCGIVVKVAVCSAVILV